jgi:DNA-binding PadR family transcriptional regulator
VIEEKRRLSNPLALAVLVLLYERPMHPYEMACTLRERHKEASIKLNYGSLYTIIEQLQREQFIFPRETLREGKRPEKTVYELTSEGKTELVNWMRELVSDPVKEFPQFEAALSLIPALPPDEVVQLLEIRVNLLKKVLEDRGEEGRLCKAMKLPRLFTLEREYHSEMTRAECRFSEQLLADIKRDVGGLRSTWMELRKNLTRAKLHCSKARVASGPKEKA